MVDGAITSAARPRQAFHGWRVVGAAFVLASFGWGIGLYGMPIYLHAVHAARGWPVALISMAVTTHYLCGAPTIVNLPALYGRWGVDVVTSAGELLLAMGGLGWAEARAPWQLFAATLASGAGWATMGAAAVNAIVTPWFVRRRPAALAVTYNGASVGGVIFAPLWVAAIAQFGFPGAAALVGLVTCIVILALAMLFFSKTLADLGQSPDGDVARPPALLLGMSAIRSLPGATIWRDRAFLTLAVGMALGLFAQIGLLAHLFSLLVPVFGEGGAGLAMAGATAAAVVGRTALGFWLSPGADRRLVASASYLVQISGGLLLILADQTSGPLPLLGVLLFGIGIGQYHVVAAADRAGGIHPGGRGARGALDHRVRPGFLCVCPGDLRAHPPIGRVRDGGTCGGLPVSGWCDRGLARGASRSIVADSPACGRWHLGRR